MKIGILGAGIVGEALARKLVKAGYEIAIANSRGQESLKELIAELGPKASAVTTEEASGNEVIILAVRWENTDEVLAPLQSKLAGKILIDTTNPYSQNKWIFILPKGIVASEIIAAKAPGARVVKAFNSLYGKWLQDSPEVEGGNRVTFISGDDEAAKIVVAKIATDLKFAPIDLGTLKDGEPSQGGRVLVGKNLILMKD